MVLVDTSVWVSHFRDHNQAFADLLNEGHVFCHPFIIGELACGNLQDRAVILAHLTLLPLSQEADFDEALIFIESNRLMGQGLGYVDIHLIASAVLTGVPLWSFDKKLAQAADILHVNYLASRRA